MTQVEYGGRPTIEQRSAFCAPKDGAQISLYTGHVHQYRYQKGATYGELTHRLAQTRECTPWPANEAVHHELTNELPKPTGNNKLVTNMVPGYSGYIPRKLFKFGRRYKHECDVSIDQHLTDFKTTKHLEASLRDIVRSSPKLQELNFDPDVRDHLNTYRDTHPLLPALAEPKRCPLEPPKRHWAGHVPRMWTTETGLGLNFREASSRSFDRFHYENDCHFDILQLPVSVECCPSSVPPSDIPVCRRVYMKDGMIPRWSGIVPDEKWKLGRTYGDTTRACEACAHDEVCYGNYVRLRGPRSLPVIF